MQCDDARERIGAFLDGELPDADARAVGAHLRECPACADLLADYRRMGRQIKLAGRVDVPAGLGARLDAALAASEAVVATDDTVMTPGANERRRLARGALRSYVGQAAALAAACLVAVLATWLAVTERSGSAAIERDVLSAHMRALLQDSPVQVASSDQHTVRPWFTGRLEYAPEVKDLAADGFPLVGGRLDFVDGRRVGALVYRRRLHVINVFTWPNSGPGSTTADSGPAATVRNGYNMLRWSRGGVAFWAVSDLNAAELRQLQGLL